MAEELIVFLAHCPIGLTALNAVSRFPMEPSLHRNPTDGCHGNIIRSLGTPNVLKKKIKKTEGKVQLKS